MSTMQRRHYEMIAEIIKEMQHSHDPVCRNGYGVIAEHFAEHLAKRNEGFKESTFLKACGCTTK